MNLKNLEHVQFEEIFRDIIDGKINKDDAKKILLEINEIGFKTPMFLGAMSVLKKRMKKIYAPKDAIDVCGTGGDGLETFNISTTVCFVVAACGVTVAKHGNKAISSKSGSADIFSALNIPILSDAKSIEENLREKKLCFLFAPFFHEALKHLAEIRKEIAQEFNVPTIFNFLGPVLNPTNTQRQLIGVSRYDVMMPMLEALKINGSKRVYIVHGKDKMDEITLCDDSFLLRLEDGKIYDEEIINPQNFGFRKVAIQDLQGFDANYNAQKLLALLQGEKSAYLEIVILNSAYALKLAGKVDNIEGGILMARKAIDDGIAMQVLQSLR